MSVPALVSGQDPLAVGKQELHWVKVLATSAVVLALRKDRTGLIVPSTSSAN